ncbi:MAG TPA: hypothetical protein PLL36_08355 [Candidatus Hydrogenedentes bacterium]|nr:hypothetical protein [Candidatus Hydrogenedentota bacterium]
MCYPVTGGRTNMLSLRSKREDDDSAYTPAREKIRLDICPPSAPVRFDIRSLPLRIQGANKKADIAEMSKLPPEDDLWPLVEVANIRREDADKAVAEILPGFIIGWDSPSHQPAKGENPILCCTDAALVLGVLARVRDGIYRSDTTPDYSIGHLANTVFLCCDDRVPAQPRCREMEASS